jgi:hypothetical protein
METPLVDFEARLLYVTRNLVLYGLYGKDVTKAAKVVKKYFKDKSLEECKAGVVRFVRAYEEGIIFVEANLTDYALHPMPAELALKEQEFLAAHSGLSSGILRSMLDWTYLWYQR